MQAKEATSNHHYSTIGSFCCCNLLARAIRGTYVMLYACHRASKTAEQRGQTAAGRLQDTVYLSSGRQATQQLGARIRLSSRRACKLGFSPRQPFSTTRASGFSPCGSGLGCLLVPGASCPSSRSWMCCRPNLGTSTSAHPHAVRRDALSRTCCTGRERRRIVAPPH